MLRLVERGVAHIDVGKTREIRADRLVHTVRIHGFDGFFKPFMIKLIPN